MNKNIKINKILNNGSSSETDLHFLAKELKLKINYIGSIYNLHSFHPGNYILLISPDKHILNGHWVGICIGKAKSYYFDAFGVGPPQVLTDNIKKIYYNTQQIQNLNQEHCGLFVLDFLKNKNLKHFHIYN